MMADAYQPMVLTKHILGAQFQRTRHIPGASSGSFSAFPFDCGRSNSTLFLEAALPLARLAGLTVRLSRVV